ncbi:MAG: hypothetical protein HY735_32795 [Verrucomicrobia bacterium]|nr:hypothetical protein [Verrucomicrobiota bacterium]
MQQSPASSLESALNKTETDAASTLKAGQTVVAQLKKLKRTASLGQLKDLRAAMQSTEAAVATLSQQFANTRDGWTFKDEEYFSNGRFVTELVDIARKNGLEIFERDGRVYCFPIIVRVSPAERRVLLNKKAEARVRPSVLIGILKDNQARPSQVRPEQVIDVLFRTYSKLIGDRSAEADEKVIPLADIYETLTLRPGSGREYTEQDFAQEIYILDRSGIRETRNGHSLRIIPSARPGQERKALLAVAEDGGQRWYHGIQFARASEERS